MSIWEETLQNLMVIKINKLYFFNSFFYLNSFMEDEDFALDSDWNKIWLSPSIKRKSPFCNDHNEYNYFNKLQNKFNNSLGHLIKSDINLYESVIDPDLLYFEKDLLEILRSSTKIGSLPEQLPLPLTPNYIEIKIKLPNKDKFEKDSDFEPTQKEESMINGASDQLLPHRDTSLSSLNIISENLNQETNAILYEDHRDSESSSSDSSDKSNICQNFTFNSKNTNSENSLNSIITNNFLKKVEIQNKIENEERIGKKIGRPSNNKPMKSSDINKWLLDIFQKKLINLIWNKTKEVRIDLFTTEYFRIIRKIPHYFVKDFWTQIYFKNPDISKSVVGIIEAFSAYSFSQNNFSSSDIVERVVDFSVVYFSEEKWIKLINKLIPTSDPCLRSRLKDKLRILQLRRKSSTKNMKEFANCSSTIKELFKIALNILSNFLISNLKGQTVK